MLLIDKIIKRLRGHLVRKTKSKGFYIKLYRSYWHSRIHRPLDGIEKNYFSAIPNPGAGIGHQMANWIAGYWFARQFELKFAHIPFSTQKWEDFLGFGDGIVTVDELLSDNYKKVRLPLFDQSNFNEVELVKKIIDSYSDKKVVFVVEQDQFYHDQFGLIEEIKQKFYNAKARTSDNLLYSKSNFNIAIHVRRGDITVGQLTKNPNLLMRWQDNDYFINVLDQVVKNLDIDKPIFVYLFSQGKPEDFPEFLKIDNLQFCLDMNATDSFLHMVNADLLITSKSSFSYNPALLCNGIKICPTDFWHGYPIDNDWIIADEKGSFNSMKLESNL